MIIILFCSNDLYHVVIDIIISTIIFVIILPIITKYTIINMSMVITAIPVIMIMIIILPIITNNTIINMSMVITAIPVIIIMIIRSYQSARYSMMATDCVSTRPSISRQGTLIIIKSSLLFVK